MNKQTVRQYILSLYKDPGYIKKRTVAQANSDFGLSSLGFLVFGYFAAITINPIHDTDISRFIYTLIVISASLISISSVITTRYRLIYKGNPKEKYITIVDTVSAITAYFISCFLIVFIISLILIGESEYIFHIRFRGYEMSINNRTVIFFTFYYYLIIVFTWIISNAIYNHYLIMRYCPDIKNYTIDDILEELKQIEIASKEEKRKMRKINKK